GDVRLRHVTNSCVISEDRLVVAESLDNVAVIDTRDATYVASLDAAQGVREVVAELRGDGRREVEHHPRVYRPWGSFESIDEGAGFKVKRRVINPGAALAPASRRHRPEHWVVGRGGAPGTRGEGTFEPSPHQSVDSPAGLTHGPASAGTVPLEVIGVQSGPYLGEDDVVRVEDQYGRVE